MANTAASQQSSPDWKNGLVLFKQRFHVSAFGFASMYCYVFGMTSGLSWLRCVAVYAVDTSHQYADAASCGLAVCSRFSCHVSNASSHRVTK